MRLMDAYFFLSSECPPKSQDTYLGIKKINQSRYLLIFGEHSLDRSVRRQEKIHSNKRISEKIINYIYIKTKKIRKK